MSNSDLNKKLIYTTLVFYCVCSVTGLFAAIMIYIDQKIKQIPNFLGNLLGNLVALCFLTAALTFIPSMILVFISIDHLRKYMKKTKNSDSKKKLIYNTLVSCCVCCVIVLITLILKINEVTIKKHNNDSENEYSKNVLQHKKINTSEENSIKENNNDSKNDYSIRAITADSKTADSEKNSKLPIMTKLVKLGIGISVLILIPSMILVFISIDHQRKHMKKTKKKKS